VKSIPVLWIILLSHCVITSYTQTLRSSRSVFYSSSGAYSPNQADVLSVFSNPSSLAQLQQFSAGVYGQRKFLLEELGEYRAALALPTSSGNFGFNTGYFGSAAYNETELGITYARHLGKKAELGTRFNYSSVAVRGYGKASSLNAVMGVLVHLTENLHTGFQVGNPFVRAEKNNEQERVAIIYKAGVGYEPSELVYLSVEIEKEWHKPVNINAGLQYRPSPLVVLKTGICTDVPELYLGAGFFLGSLRVDVISAYHPQLGITPGLSLVYTLKKDPV